MFSPEKAKLATNILLVAALALCGALFHPIWQPLLLAAIIAAVLHGPKERLAHRLGDRPALATAIVLSSVMGLFILPLAVLTTIAVSQTVSAINFVRDALSTGGLAQLMDKLPERLERAAKQILALVPGGLRGLVDKLGGGAQVADWAQAFLSLVSEAIFQIAMVLIALYFLLLEGSQLVDWVVLRSPIGVLRSQQLLNTYRRAGRAVLASTIITAAAQSMVAGVGYLIARVPQPMFFTLLTFLTAFVPSVGTAIVALPLCGLLWATGHTFAAIFLLIYSIVVVATVDNLIKPFLMGDGMKLNSALIFFALVGGVITFGPIGLVLGPLGMTFFFSIVALDEEAPQSPLPALAVEAAPAAAPAPEPAPEPAAPAPAAAPDSKEPT